MNKVIFIGAVAKAVGPLAWKTDGGSGHILEYRFLYYKVCCSDDLP